MMEEEKEIAVVTGASSGIGKEIAMYLAKLGYEIIAVAREKEKLEQLKKEIPTKLEIYCVDISKEEECYTFFNEVKEKNIAILINNAGFGAFGEFEELSLERELSLIKTNDIGMHILMKLFLNKMRENKQRSYILNVASLASFMPGPLMATYYASKAYVLRLTQGVEKELRKKDSKVSVSCVCPGPVATNFNEVAGVQFSIKPLTPAYVAKYAIDQMKKGKTVIIPGMMNKIGRFLTRFVPDSLVAEVCYHIQKRKKR